MWRRIAGADCRTDHDRRDRTADHGQRRNAPAPPQSQASNALAHPHTHRSPGAGLMLTDLVSQPKDRRPRQLGVRSVRRRLVCPERLRRRASLDGGRRHRLDCAAQRDAGSPDVPPRLGPASALQAQSQLPRRGRNGIEIRVAPIELRGRAIPSRRLVDQRAASRAAGDLPGQSLGLIPVILGDARARHVVAAQPADRRQRRLVRPAPAARLDAHSQPITLASMMSDSIKSG